MQLPTEVLKYIIIIMLEQLWSKPRSKLLIHALSDVILAIRFTHLGHLVKCSLQWHRIKIEFRKITNNKAVFNDDIVHIAHLLYVALCIINKNICFRF